MNNSKKYYNLLPSQHLLFYAQKFCLSKQVNTICTSYLFKMDFDDKLLKKAIRTAYKKQECMRLRITKIGKDVVQYIADYEDPEVKVVDFSKKSAVDEEKFFNKVAHKKLSRFDKKMNEIYIVHSRDGYSGLALATSHLALDAFAIFAFYKLIIDYYMHYSEGTPAPKDPASYISMVEKEFAYEDSAQAEKDTKYWEEFYSTPVPVYTDIAGPRLLEKMRKKHPDSTCAMTFSFNPVAKHLVLKYDKNIINKIEVYSKQNNVSANAIITTAISVYLMAMNNINDITLYLTYARRATIAEKTAGGSKACAFPFRQIFDYNSSFESAVLSSFEQQCETMFHTKANPMKVMAFEETHYNKPLGGQFYAMCFTYQPMHISSPHNVRFKLKWYGNGAASQPLYPTVMDCDGTGDLHCYYEYKPKSYTPEEITAAHKGFLKVLNIAMDNPEISLREIIKQISK